MKYSIELASLKIADVAVVEGLDLKVEYAPEEIKTILGELLPFAKYAIEVVRADTAQRRDTARDRVQALANEIRNQTYQLNDADTAEQAKLNIGIMVDELSSIQYRV